MADDRPQKPGSRRPKTGSTVTNGAAGNLDPTVIGMEASLSTEATEVTSSLSIGNYEILSELARGGMGVVFRARQRGINRIVALKMILSGQLAGQAEVKRFQAEAEAAGRLDHPNIVPIFDVGEHHGQPYFSMGFVDGESLSTVLRRGPVEPSRAARLMREVAAAVHYAHGRGIVHRDLKPGNIILDKRDVPRVTDFGLAKHASNTGEITSSGDVLGTPGYMPPEQALGRTDLVDARSDVYSLGATLYCLLVSRPPFQAASLMDTLWQVIHVEPVPIRQLNPKIPVDLETICLKALQKDRGRRYQSASELAEELGRFLRREPILARPISRYERLLRWCSRNPVIAALIFLTTSSLIIGMAATTYYGRTASIRASEAEEAKKQSQKDTEAAIKSRDEASTARDAAARLARSEGIAKTEALQQLERAEAAVYAGLVQQAERDLLVQDFEGAQSKLNQCRWDLRSWEHNWLTSQLNAQCRQLRLRLTHVRNAALSPDGRVLATVEHNITNGPSVLRIWDSPDPVSTPVVAPPVARLVLPLGNVGQDLRTEFSADGRRVAAYYDFNGQALLVGFWSVKDGTSFLESEPAFSKLLNEDKTCLISTSQERADGKRRLTIKRFSSDTAASETLQVDETLIPLRFTSEGDAVFCVTGKQQETLQLLDLKGLSERWSLAHHKIGIVAGPSGQYWARMEPGSTSYEILSIDKAETVSRITRQSTLPGVPLGKLEFSPDEETIVTCEPVSYAGGREGPCLCYVWDTRSGQLRFSIEVATNRSPFVFSKDGRTMFCREADRELVVRDVQTGRELREITNGGLAPQELTLSPTGQLIAVVYGGRGACQVYETNSGRRAFSLPDSEDLRSIRFSASDLQITGTWVGQVATYEILPPLSRLAIKGHEGRIRDVCFHPDNRRLATAAAGDVFRDPEDPDHSVRVWDGETGAELSRMPRSDGARAVSFSPDGTLLASSSFINSNAPSVTLTNVSTGEDVVSLQSLPIAGCRTLQFSADQTKLIGATNTSVVAWDVKTGVSLPASWPGTELARSATFLKDADTVAVGSAIQVYTRDFVNVASGVVGRRADTDPELRIFAFSSGQLIAALPDHDNEVRDIRISPNGKWIASSSRDGTIVIWDGTTYQRVSRLFGHQHTVCRVRWTPDSRRLITAGADRTIRFWDPASGVEVFRLNSEVDASDREWVGDETLGFDVSPDGQRIVVGGDLGRLRLWTSRQGGAVFSFPGRARHLTWADSESLATSDGSNLDSWDVVSGQLDHRVTGARFFPGMVAADSTKRVFLVAPDLREWDLLSGTSVLKLREESVSSHYDHVAVSRDGRYLALAVENQDRVEVWDWKSRQLLHTFEHLHLKVQALSFSSDGNHLLDIRSRGYSIGSESANPAIFLYDLGTGAQRTLFEDQHVRFACGDMSPVQKQCVVGSRELWTEEKQWLENPPHGSLMVIDWSDDVSIRTISLEDETNPQPDRLKVSVAAVDYSPDGRYVAVAIQSSSLGRDEYGVARIYDVASGAMVGSQRIESTEISDIEFNPDGTRVAIALGSRGTALWHLPDLD